MSTDRCSAQRALSVASLKIEHMSDALVDRVAGGVEDLTASDLLALARERKAAEERALAVVDGARDGNTEKVGLHQKYPSRLRSSIAASVA